MIPEDDYQRVLIAAPQVQAIALEDNGEKLADVAQAGLLLADPQRRILLRESVLERLLRVQSRLPQGLRLEIHDGWISLEQQQRYFDERFALVQQEQPQLSPEEAFTETTRLASPVINRDGSRNTPPHSTGGAVDLALVDTDGQRLDFGMQIQDWATADPAVSETRSKKIPAMVQATRAVLYQGMIAAGFVNYYTEWWHYSYGDKYWAFQSGQPQAIYGSVKHP